MGRLQKYKIEPELPFIISIAILAKNGSKRVETTRNILYVQQTVKTEPFHLNNMYTKPYVPISLCTKLYYMCYNIYIQISHIHHEIPSC